eukprot:IDg5686t1
MDPRVEKTISIRADHCTSRRLSLCIAVTFDVTKLPLFKKRLDGLENPGAVARSHLETVCYRKSHITVITGPLQVSYSRCVFDVVLLINTRVAILRAGCTGVFQSCVAGINKPFKSQL